MGAPARGVGPRAHGGRDQGGVRHGGAVRRRPLRRRRPLVAVRPRHQRRRRRADERGARRALLGRHERERLRPRARRAHGEERTVRRAAVAGRGRLSAGARRDGAEPLHGLSHRDERHGQRGRRDDLLRVAYHARRAARRDRRFLNGDRPHPSAGALRRVAGRVRLLLQQRTRLGQLVGVPGGRCQSWQRSLRHLRHQPHPGHLHRALAVLFQHPDADDERVVRRRVRRERRRQGRRRT